MDDTQPKKSNLRRIISGFFALILLLTILRLTGMRDLSQFEDVDPVLLGLGIVSLALVMTTYSLRWFVVIKGFLPTSSVNIYQTYRYSMQSLLAGNFFAQTASNLVVRSASLNTHKDISLRASIGTVITDKLFDLLLLVVYFPIILLVLSDQITVMVALWLAVVVSILLILACIFQYDRCLQLLRRLIMLVQVILSKIPWVRSLKQLQRIDEVSEQIDRLSQHMDMQRVLVALLLSFFGQALLVLRSWFIAQSVGVDVSIVWMFIGVVAAQASLFIAITPGGVGFLEGAWLIVFASVGINSASVGAFFLLERFAKLLVNVVLYLLSLVLTMRNHERVSSPAETPH